MAMQVFPFTFLRAGFREYQAFSAAVHEQGGGRRVLQELHAAGELVVRGRLLFPNRGRTYRELEGFWAAQRGPALPFLYAPQNPGAKSAKDTIVALGGQTDFTASRRHATALLVRKGGVLQEPGTQYTLLNESGGAYVLGTSSKLIVHFLAAPGGGVVVALEYDFFHAMRFEGDDLPDEQELHTGGVASAHLADRTVAVQMRETGPGFHLEAVPATL